LDKELNDNHHLKYDYVLLYYEELEIDEDHLMLNDLMDLLYLMLRRMMMEELVVEEEQLMVDRRLLLIHLLQE
jgi:hypothetical protein